MTNNTDFEFGNPVIIKISNDRTNRLLKKIIVEEATNIKSKGKTEVVMIKYIRDLIEEEVKCYSNS
jgi:hypothetical protein